MLEAGIFDPTKVTRVALKNAAYIPEIPLANQCAITEVKSANQLWQWVVECQE